MAPPRRPGFVARARPGSPQGARVSCRNGGRAWDMTRVAAIGLDAAEGSFVERLIQQGQLPNLAKIRARSAECRLRNVVAYRSELPYTQFLTGKEAATNRYWSTVA